MTLQEVKDILGITSTKHDLYIQTSIPLLTEFIQDYSNNTFADENGNVVLKGGSKIALAKMIEYNMNKSGQSSRSFGEVSYSFDTDFPQSILKLLQPYLRIKV
jgi:hypothetical protein